MGSRWKYILRAIFSRRENWVFIPVIIIILILLISTIYTVYLTTPSRPQLSLYSDNWGDLSNCREDIKDYGFEVSSIISTPTILSKIDEDKYKDMVYVAVGVERPYTEEEANLLWEFMRKGGNLIIADDFGHGSSLWEKAPERRFGNIKFENLQLFDPNYIKNTTFVTVNVSLESMNYNLILNEPTALEISGNFKHTKWASSSKGSWLDENGNRVRDPQEPLNEYPVIVYLADQGDEGEAIIISDPGLFINDNWDRLDNSEFVLGVLSGLLPDGGEVIFDESRHINQEPLENSRRIFYSGMVYFTSTVWSIIIVVTLIISFTLIIGVRIKPQVIWRNTNLLDKKYFNILNSPHVGPYDYWQIYNAFLEKVRLSYGFSTDEFRKLDHNMLRKMIDDPYLCELITQEFRMYADNKYYSFIIQRVLTWKPVLPSKSDSGLDNDDSEYLEVYGIEADDEEFDDYDNLPRRY